MTDNYDIHRIEQLLDRFFDGDTTLAEERELEQFFTSTSGEQLPEHLRPYREMFGWFASGMPEEQLQAPMIPVPVEPQGAHGNLLRRPRVKWLAWWTSAAAVAALVIGFGWQHHAERLEGLEAMYAESYVVRDGIVITGTSEVQTEIDAAMIEMQILDMELNEAQYSLQYNNTGL